MECQIVILITDTVKFVAGCVVAAVFIVMIFR